MNDINNTTEYRKELQSKMDTELPKSLRWKDDKPIISNKAHR